MTRSLEEILEAAAKAATTSGATFMVIGGCARNAYAPPRATRDVDLAIDIDATGYAAFVDEMRRLGFNRTTVVNESADAVPDVLLLSDGGGGRVDLLFAKTEFERDALSRRVRLEGVSSAYVATAEDLVIYKLIAGRPQDMADIHEVLSARRDGGHVIDWIRMESWAEKWGVAGRLRRVRTAVARGRGPDRGPGTDLSC